MIINLINPPSSGGVGVETDPLSLHLTGGTLTGAIDFSVDGAGNDAEVGSWGFGVERNFVPEGYIDNLQQITTVEPHQIKISLNSNDGGSVSGSGPTYKEFLLSSDGYNNYPSLKLTFNDDTYTRDALFNCTGVSGTHTDGFLSWSLSSWNVSGSGAYDETPWSFGVDGAHFSDGTIQTTASVDLSQGGNIYGNLNFKITNSETTYFQFNSEDGVLYIGGGLGMMDGGGFQFDWGTPYYWSFYDGVITFPDSSTQTTAGIPEAPQDGNAYVRKNGAWVDITTL